MVRTLVAVTTAITLASCAESKGPENPVIGIITSVEADRIELEWGDSQSTEFQIVDQTVKREHLIDHMRKRWPVKVTFEGEGAPLEAVLIEDASPAPLGSPSEGETLPTLLATLSRKSPMSHWA